ncbi:MAG: acetyl-CoA carboxylase, biotin carboxyl carrier protein [Holosporales bacterium]|jgi:acetyl-CoA carboxylase biotin carboxyl carrier protein|nr:acetyl-CoA carboxylase, biotin carboxyl carrier protein [Holosporales bacterium]
MSSSFKIDESAFDKLAEILKKHGLSEIEYKEGDRKIRISMTTAQQATILQSTKEVSSEFSTQSAATVSSSPLIQDSQNTDNIENNAGIEIKSPMVGTCYMSPEPGAACFVKIGDEVAIGQPLLIIEAMKVMNLIKSQYAGKVSDIKVLSGDSVEYGQVLLILE